MATSHPRSISLAPRLALAPLALALCALAQAQDNSGAAGDTGWRISLSQDFTHDTNINRAADALAAADWVSTTSADVRLMLPLSRQKLTLAAGADLVRFRDHSDQNDVGYRLMANWDWSLPSQFEGTLGADARRHRFLGGVNTAGLGETADQTQNAWLTARKSVAADWSIDAAARLFRRSVTPAALNYNDQRHTSLEAGVRYQSNPDLGLGLLGRWTKGSYPNLMGIGDDFNRRDLEASMNWQLSGATALEATAGVARETHSLASTEDTTNAYGSVQLRWMPSDKLSLVALARRDRSSGVSTRDGQMAGNTPADSGLGSPATAFDQAGTSSLNSLLQLTADWQFTAFLRGTGGVSWLRRSLSQTVGASAMAGNDRLAGVWLGLTYLPIEQLELACRVGQQRRSADAGAPSYAYSQRSYGCLARYTFGGA